MTLQQLRYVTMIANKKTLSEAAKALFITQPSLTAAIKDLEEEIGITIFHRTNKGVTLTTKGEEFLGYARQMLEQLELIEEKYKGKACAKQQFCVSAQHYSFVVEAFVDLLKDYEKDAYEFKIRETQTYEIIEDVARLKSEIGVLFLNPYNETVIKKELKQQELKFYPLFTAKPHVFISKDHPLSKKKSIELSDLAPYPRLSYEQGDHNAFYFSEEILSTLDCERDIIVRDRATLFNLLIGLNGYTISSGVISEELNGKNIISIPLLVDDYMQIGYVLHDRVIPGPITQQYIEYLRQEVGDLHYQ